MWQGTSFVSAKKIEILFKNKWILDFQQFQVASEKNG